MNVRAVILFDTADGGLDRIRIANASILQIERALRRANNGGGSHFHLTLIDPATARSVYRVTAKQRPSAPTS